LGHACKKFCPTRVPLPGAPLLFHAQGVIGIHPGKDGARRQVCERTGHRGKKPYQNEKKTLPESPWMDAPGWLGLKPRA
jgi:hypothetical protein